MPFILSRQEVCVPVFFLPIILHWIDSKQKLHDNYRSKSTEASNQTIHPRNSTASTHLILLLMLLPPPLPVPLPLVLYIYLLNYIRQHKSDARYTSFKSYNVHRLPLFRLNVCVCVFKNVCFCVRKYTASMMTMRAKHKVEWVKKAHGKYERCIVLYINIDAMFALSVFMWWNNAKNSKDSR